MCQNKGWGTIAQIGCKIHCVRTKAVGLSPKLTAGCFINNALLVQSQPIHLATVSGSFPATVAELGVYDKDYKAESAFCPFKKNMAALALDQGLEEHFKDT